MTLPGPAQPPSSPAALGHAQDESWAATWAVRFYESHGFRRLGDGESQELLKRYWEIPSRQMETSLVLELGA